MTDGPPCIPNHPDGKIEKPKKAAEALQTPGRPDSKHLSHHQSQIARGHLDQVTLVDFFLTAQPSSPRSARLAHMGEGPFHFFASLTLESFAAVSTHTPPVCIRRLFLTCRLVRPAILMRTLRLRNVRAKI